MKNLYDPSLASDVKRRLDLLSPTSPRAWGKMTAPQAVAHCAMGLEMATGEFNPPRMLIGRIIGPIITRLALGNDTPMRPDSPTVPQMVISDTRDLDHERARLRAAIDRFTSAGPSRCTTHPHPFFGKLTPAQWAELMYKHLDHHLRQFGV